MKSERIMPIICAWCGKFASYQTVSVDYTPDTAFTAERVEFKCQRCRDKDRTDRHEGSAV